MVRIKDREKEVEYLRMALHLVGIELQYEHAELVIKTQKELNKLKGKFSIRHAVELKIANQERWDKYYDNINKELEEETPKES